MHVAYASSVWHKSLRLGARRCTTRARARTAVNMVKVDAHVHVWDSNFATADGKPVPAIDGTADDLVRRMDAAGVDKTLVVQPINYKFDHSCVSDAMARHAGRLYGVALADTSLDAGAAAEAVGRLLDAGYRGVRINPSFAPLGSAAVAAALGECAKRGLPACVFARPEHYGAVERLLATAGCALVVDHFGFAGSDAERKQLLSFAAYPNAYVKASAWFRVSREAHPHGDAQRLLREVVGAYGARRILAGTDYPYVMEQYAYGATFDAAAGAGLSAADLQLVQGGAAAELYKLHQ